MLLGINKIAHSLCRASNVRHGGKCSKEFWRRTVVLVARWKQSRKGRSALHSWVELLRYEPRMRRSQKALSFKFALLAVSWELFVFLWLSGHGYIHWILQARASFIGQSSQSWVLRHEVCVLVDELDSTWTFCLYIYRKLHFGPFWAI